MVSGYKNLKVYQLAFKAAIEIFELTKKFPYEERFSLTDQIRRSSRSVCTCIGEGYRKREREGERGRKIQALEKKIENSREMITTVEDKYFRSLIDDPTYQKAKSRYEDELIEQEQEMKRLKEMETGYMKYLKKALTLLENLDRYWKELPREEKQKLLYELFPGKLIYDNGKFVNQSEEGIGLLVEDIRENNFQSR